MTPRMRALSSADGLSSRRPCRVRVVISTSEPGGMKRSGRILPSRPARPGSCAGRKPNRGRLRLGRAGATLSLHRPVPRSAEPKNQTEVGFPKYSLVVHPGVPVFLHVALAMVLLAPAGNLEARQFDLLGQVVRVHEPDGNVRELGYDGEGNVVRAKDKDYDVEFKYGGMNRLLARTQGGTTVRFAYDTEEDLTAIFNEAGAAYRFVLGPTGEVKEEHGFDGLRRQYERDHRPGSPVTRIVPHIVP